MTDWEAIVVSGQGEFVARRIASSLQPNAELISLRGRLGSALSACATAHAVAVLAIEEME